MGVWVEVAWGEGAKVVPPFPELTGFVGVGVELGVRLGVTEGLAKSRVVEWYEVFRVFSRGCGRYGWSSGPFFALP